MPSSITYGTLFEQLPLEILPIVIHHLGPKDTNTCIMVCKFWNNIFKDNVCWKSFNKDYKFIQADELLKENDAHLFRIKDMAIRKNIAQGKHQSYSQSLRTLKKEFKEKSFSYLGRWGNNAIVHLTDWSTTKLIVTNGKTSEFLDCGPHAICQVMEFNNMLLASTTNGKIVELKKNNSPRLFYDGTNSITDMSVFLDDVLLATKTDKNLRINDKLLIIDETGKEILEKPINFSRFLVIKDRIVILKDCSIGFYDKNLEFLKDEPHYQALNGTELYLYDDQVVIKNWIFSSVTILKNGEPEILNPLLNHCEDLVFNQNFVALKSSDTVSTIISYGDVNSIKFNKKNFEISFRNILFIGGRIFMLGKNNLHVLDFTS
ncbi:MAG: F-box protein [Parachlamydiales bacterium]|nr:F-box protein [Parachlamydiales bacterium]